jgi:hypothetical protein
MNTECKRNSNFLTVELLPMKKKKNFFAKIETVSQGRKVKNK